jgi:hypothetical protein
VLGCVTAPVIDEGVDAGYWRARAERAELLVAELRADKAGLNARVAELAGQVARLQEAVTTLSGLLFSSSSEKGGSPSRRNGRDGGGRPGGAGKRGSGRAGLVTGGGTIRISRPGNGSSTWIPGSGAAPGAGSRLSSWAPRTASRSTGR